MYTADLVSLVERYELSPHLYADDTQVYGSCSPCDVDSFLTRVSQCTCAVAEWMQSNRLQLNCDKTDFAWFTTSHSIHRLPTMGSSIGSVTVVPSQSLCHLGVFIDADLTMRTQVQRIASRGFAALRRLRSIRRYVPTSLFRSLDSAFDWIIVIACWSTCRPSCFNASSRSRILRRDSSTDCVDRSTLSTHC